MKTMYRPEPSPTQRASLTTATIRGVGQRGTMAAALFALLACGTSCATKAVAPTAGPMLDGAAQCRGVDVSVSTDVAETLPVDWSIRISAPANAVCVAWAEHVRRSSQNDGASYVPAKRESPSVWLFPAPVEFRELVGVAGFVRLAANPTYDLVVGELENTRPVFEIPPGDYRIEIRYRPAPCPALWYRDACVAVSNPFRLTARTAVVTYE